MTKVRLKTRLIFFWVLASNSLPTIPITVCFSRLSNLVFEVHGSENGLRAWVSPSWCLKLIIYLELFCYGIKWGGLFNFLMLMAIGQIAFQIWLPLARHSPCQIYGYYFERSNYHWILNWLHEFESKTLLENRMTFEDLHLSLN